MLEILSNGSKWYGEAPDSIGVLLNRLATYPLDPRFEMYGDFIQPFEPISWTEKMEKYRGCTIFTGNFYGVTHAFRIVTDEAHVVEKLTKAIRENQQREDYLQARQERFEMGFPLGVTRRRSSVSAS